MMISFSAMEILMNYLFLHIYANIFLALCIDKNIFSLEKDIPLAQIPSYFSIFLVMPIGLLVNSFIFLLFWKLLFNFQKEDK